MPTEVRGNGFQGLSQNAFVRASANGADLAMVNARRLKLTGGDVSRDALKMPVNVSHARFGTDGQTADRGETVPEITVV